MTKKYTGRLGKKRRFESDDLFDARIRQALAPDLQAKRNAQFTGKRLAESVELLGELLDHYHLERGDWFGLALSLAHDHVPAFQVDVRSLKGGQNKIPPYRDWFIIGQVQEHIESGEARNVRHACLLQAEGDFADLPGEVVQRADQLEERYKNACQRLFGRKSIPPGWQAELRMPLSSLKMVALVASKLMEPDGIEMMNASKASKSE